ncbi:MAG: tautomerase family protein [Rhizobiales bacterium]|nr:tautomerase family protein [Hyphomicrobiales bacterium]
MPEVIVHRRRPHPRTEEKLMLAITDAVVKEFGAPKESVTVTIMEAPRDMKMKAGVLFSER